MNILETPSDHELYHVESSGVTATYSHGGTAAEIEVLIFDTDYIAIAFEDTLGGSDKSIPIQQFPDDNYVQSVDGSDRWYSLTPTNGEPT